MQLDWVAMSKQIKKAQYEKRLRIAVRFDGTHFALLDCSPLPAIAKDAVCELVLRPELLQNPADRDRLVRDEVFPILTQGTTVLLGVSPHSVGDPKAPGLICNPQERGVQTEYWLVEVRLEQDLYIRIRGDQEAKLESCKCVIPALKLEATSINHAFTLISEAYETNRLSHTGNVFERTYTPVGPKRWQTLDDLRIKAIAQSLQTKLEFPAGKEGKK
jgi:hypothetical protein